MKFKIILLLLISSSFAFSQIPVGYYNPANGLTGTALQSALHSIIKNHTVVPYGSLYAAFDSTDIKSDSTVWDIYSDVPGGPQPYVYYNDTSWRCGNYNSEADCFNREHSWPQSWFNGISPAYSDMFHIYPTDGWVNGKRSNYPYGEVGTATWTSMNGSKLGLNTTVGYNLTVFEPIDEYKGDLARGYFYMSTRYLGEDTLWSFSDAVNKAVIEPWELCVLLSWHHQDAVSAKEINRNNGIYKWQNNRNPYIDHPEWVDSVFSCALAGITANEKAAAKISVFPNPCSEKVTVTFPDLIAGGKISLFSSLGEGISSQEIKSAKEITLDLSEKAKGIYMISIQTAQGRVWKKLIIDKPGL